MSLFNFKGNWNGHSMKKQQSILKTCQSVLWAFLGVQSDSNREQDFTQGSALQFIVIGIVVVVLFILGLMWIASAVLS